MICQGKSIIITKGDDFSWAGSPPITFTIDTSLDLTGFSAIVKIGQLEYSFDDISSKKFTVNITHEQSALLPIGSIGGSLIVKSPNDEIKTFTTALPFFVRENVSNNVDLSGEDVIVYAIQDGENIININVDTDSVDLSDYVTKETFVASNAELTQKVDEETTKREQADVGLQADIDEIIQSKGVANGIATLGADGKVPSSQLPDIGGTPALADLTDVSLNNVTEENILVFDNNSLKWKNSDKLTSEIATRTSEDKALSDKIDAFEAQKGVGGGLATLDNLLKLSESQVPDNLLKNSATQAQSLALGGTTSGNYSVCYGFSAECATNGASFGYSAKSANNSVSIGYTAKAISANSVAIGNNARTSASNYTFAVAIGDNAIVGGPSAVAVGGGARATQGSVAIGRGAISAGTFDCIQIGYGSNITASTAQFWTFPMLNKTTGHIPAGRLAETTITGTAEPTTSTVGAYVGQLYVNSTDETVYICTKIDGSTYSWKKLL